MPIATRLIAAFVSGAAVVTIILWMVSGDSLDFIERHLDFSPDRGDGSVELLIILVLTGTVLGMTLRLPPVLRRGPPR
jgi:hypothetical protein